MKKIANQGMINMETHHTGDLIIQFDVEFPPMNFFTDPNALQVNQFTLINYFLFIVLCHIAVGKYFTSEISIRSPIGC